MLSDEEYESSFNSVESISERLDDEENETQTIDILLISHTNSVVPIKKIQCHFTFYGLHNVVNYKEYVQNNTSQTLESILQRTSIAVVLLDDVIIEDRDFIDNIIDLAYKISSLRQYFAFCGESRELQTQIETQLSSEHNITLDEDNAYNIPDEEPFFSEAIYELVKMVDPKLLHLGKITPCPGVTLTNSSNLLQDDYVENNPDQYRKYLDTLEETLQVRGRLLQVQCKEEEKLFLMKHCIQTIKSKGTEYIYFEFDETIMNTTYMLLYILNHLKGKFKCNRRVNYCMTDLLEDSLVPSKNNITLCNILAELLDKLSTTFVVILNNTEVLSEPEMHSFRNCMEELSQDLVIIMFSKVNFSDLLDEMHVCILKDTSTIQHQASMVNNLQETCNDGTLVKVLNILSSSDYLSLDALKSCIGEMDSPVVVQSIIADFHVVDSTFFKLNANLIPKIKKIFQSDYCAALLSTEYTIVQGIRYLFDCIEDEVVLLVLFNSFTFVFTLWRHMGMLLECYRTFIHRLYYKSSISIQLVDYIYSIFKLVSVATGTGLISPPKALSTFLFLSKSCYLGDIYPYSTIINFEENKGFSSLLRTEKEIILNNDHKLTYFNSSFDVLLEEQDESFKIYLVPYDSEKYFKIKLDPGYSPILFLNGKELGTFFIEMGSGLNLYQVTYIKSLRIFSFRVCSTLYVFDCSQLFRKHSKFERSPRQPRLISTINITHATFINKYFDHKNFFAYNIDAKGFVNFLDVNGKPITSLERMRIPVSYGVTISTSEYVEDSAYRLLVVGLTNGALYVRNLDTSDILVNDKFHESGITKILVINVLSSTFLITASADTSICFYDLEKSQIARKFRFSNFAIRDCLVNVEREVIYVHAVDAAGTLYSAFLFDFELFILKTGKQLKTEGYWNDNPIRRVHDDRSHSVSSNFRTQVELLFPTMHHKPSKISQLLHQQVIKLGSVPLLFGVSTQRHRKSSITNFDKRIRTKLGRNSSRRANVQDITISKLKHTRDLPKCLINSQQLSCLATRRDGSFFAFSPMDSQILLYSLEFKKFLDINKVARESSRNNDSISKSYIGHQHPITVLVFSRDNKYLATGCEAGFVCLWDCSQSFTLIAKYAHNLTISSIAFDALTSYIASGSHDHILKLWTLKSSSNLLLRQDAIDQFKKALPGQKKTREHSAKRQEREKSIKRKERESLGRRPNRVSARRNYRRRTEEIDFRKKKKRHKRVSAMSRANVPESRRKNSIQLNSEISMKTEMHVLGQEAILQGPLKECLVFLDFHGPPNSISFNSKLNLLAACCTSHYGVLKVWQLNHNEEYFADTIETIDKPALGEQFPKLVFFSHDCKYMVCGCEQTTKVESSHLVVLYEIRYSRDTLRFRRARALYITGFPSYVYLGLSLNNSYLAEISAGTQVRYWHIKSNKEVKPEIQEEYTRRKESMISFTSNIRSRLYRSTIRDSKNSLDTTATKTVGTLDLASTHFQFHQQASSNVPMQTYPSYHSIKDNSIVSFDGEDTLDSITFPNFHSHDNTSYVVDTSNRSHSILVRGSTINTFEN